GRIRQLDLAAAQQAAGVLGVITNENAPTMKPPPTVPPFSSGEQVKGTAATDLPVLGNAMIYWNGQPVAVVVAETLEQAEYAASLVHVEYDAQPARLSFDALKSTASAPYDALGDPPHVEIGHDASALAQATVAGGPVY